MNLTIFILGGGVVIAAGVMQAVLRPRQPGETAMQRVVNASTIRAIFFVVVGVLAILVGTGKLPLLPMGR